MGFPNREKHGIIGSIEGGLGLGCQSINSVDLDQLINKFKNVRTNLSNLKNKVDKLDVDELVPVPSDLSKLSNVLKTMLLKKMYIMLR